MSGTVSGVRLGDDSLSTTDVAALARDPRAPRAVVEADALSRMARSVARRDALVASRQPVYGVTTGFGDRNVSHVAPDRAATLQRHLVNYHLVGTGPTAPAEVARATMLIRANCLARGWSGVRPAVVDLLLDCLANDVLPLIPERGSVGASGDLVPLSYLASLLTGHGDALHAGRRVPAADALAACGLRPAVLEAKEALALINGTSFMAGFAVLALADAVELTRLADACTALTVEVLRGNPGHYAAAIHAQKPHPGQVASAALIRQLLAGSGLTEDHHHRAQANGALGERGHRLLSQPIQDRYSVRCSPHVVGVLRDTLDWADRWLTIEINSTNDNPLFEPDDDGSVLHGGNFYGGHVGLAMDSVKVAVASVGDLLDRQFASVVDVRTNNGLTPGLIPRHTSDDTDAGLHHGFKGAQIVCSALVAEALKLGMPATAFSRSTEAHNQDKVSMGTIAARDARDAVVLVREAAALHLAALCQAADLRGPELLAPGTRCVYDLVRRHVGFLAGDRRLDAEVADLTAALRHGALSAVLSHDLETIHA